jgi:cell wall-associated NlpC family hydrolase
MRMLFESSLDNPDRALGNGLVGAALAILSLLAIAICLPVLVLAILLGATLSEPGAPASTAAQSPATEARTLLASPAAPSATADTPTDDTRFASNSSVIDVARRYLGVPYIFGGTDPTRGLDCSGLVQLVFRQLGIALPRTAQQQYAATSRLTQDQLRPGDLVFFARTYADPHDWVTHVGIYIGNGQQINAPTEGQVVSIQPVFTGFWGAHFTGGGRVAAR